MRVVVTGCQRIFVGAPLVAHLLARGDAVTAFVREPERARGLLGAAKIVRADLEKITRPMVRRARRRGRG